MEDEMKKHETKISNQFYRSSRHILELDFIPYLDEIAAKINVKPNLMKYAISDPKLFFKLYFGPFLPYQFRLQGLHSSWKNARQTILDAENRIQAPFH